MTINNMNRIFLLIIISFSISFLASCKKDNDGKELNTLKITDGDFNGYSHTFTPNLGFWSPVSDDVNYVHLVLGDDDNLATAAENVMSIVFYDTGNPQVTFPSAEGQWVNFGINFNGTVYYFGAENATLSILHFDDTKFEGTLSGEFVNMSNSSQKISFAMQISVMMQEI